MMRHTPTVAIVLFACLAAAPTTKPAKQETYTVEQIIKAIPKEDRPPADSTWTQLQVKNCEKAIEKLLDGKSVTLKAIDVGQVRQTKDGVVIDAGSGFKVVGDYYVALSCHAPLSEADAKRAAKLQPKDAITISGIVKKVAVSVETLRMSKGHWTKIEVEFSDASFK